MKLTIITVCYNAQTLIRNTIESVLGQTFQDFEYLIIDGKSTDDTVSIVREYINDSRIKVFVEKDFGIYNAMNRGICRASGKFIYFLNAGDVFYESDTLEKVDPYLLGTDTVYCGEIQCLKTGGIDTIVSYEGTGGSVTDKFLKGIMPCHQTIFAPSSSLKNHFFQEKYKLRADFQWFYDSILQEFSLETIPVVIAKYNTLGESSNTFNLELMSKETKQIQDVFFESRNVTIPGMKLPPQTEFEWKTMAEKHFRIIKLFDNWLALKQQGRSLVEYFIEHNIKNIAIYGMGHIGLRLLKELDGTDIVKFAIDRKKIEVCVPVITIEEKFEPVDAIVITAVNDYDEIMNVLRTKVMCQVICFDEIIHECLLYS